ncbi:TetR/AcrR family transcriptional regulator C-terminal domain-containing protein [Nocardioides sp. NBC_00850]|uniref:TetR/AcrR family transcriptional regulator n=1 Tax=Nocardioides sp. NBC_00850 TaxID=2976001 RepID=UPI002FACF54C|nr:TetR/AcrR family transcriptional regulator C-terminal domain-containing protein [Nocardioides sp. NBC_00850]
MTQITQRRVGRPRKAVLDRVRIGATALELVDDSGDFTLPELAQRLGVHTSSLYHHVDGRSGVIELLREQVSDQMDAAALEREPWDVAIPAFFRSYRAVFAAHPRVVPLLTTTTVRSPQVLAAYDRMVALLEELGFPVARAMEVLTAVESFVIGSALDLAAPDVMWEIPEGVEAPRLAEALASQRDAAHRAEAAFECGLRMMLAGVAAELGASTA